MVNVPPSTYLLAPSPDESEPPPQAVRLTAAATERVSAGTLSRMDLMGFLFLEVMAVLVVVQSARATTRP